MDNGIKVYVKEIECEIMPWINCVQDRDQGQDIIEVATKV
jgi:hypothetical protein